MATSEERLRVLKMVEEGKLAPEAAAKLLNALTESARTKTGEAAQPRASEARTAGSGRPSAASMAEAAVARMMSNVADSTRPRKLRIRVNNERDGKQRKQVDITVPMTAAGFVARLIDKFVPKQDRGGVDLGEVMDAVRNGATGKIVDIVSEDGDTIEISIE
jgi:polyhydroxyalkanoate synthesis regulator phasin